MSREENVHRRLAILLISALMLGTVSLWFPGQTAQAKVTQSGGTERTTVWSGVYTEAQAARGKAVFVAQCQACHGESLQGTGANPPLQGERFFESWREDNLLNLFTKMRELMPRRDPGSLSDSQYLDIVAHILQSNSFPTGPNELNSSALRTIQIEGKDGPKPLPNRTMVQIVGCMTQSAGDTWLLTMVPLPSRTREPDTTTPEELKGAAAKPLGTLTFQLQNLDILGAFDIESHKGHKMQAKGLLLKQPTGERISVTSLDMVASNCGH